MCYSVRVVYMRVVALLGKAIHVGFNDQAELKIQFIFCHHLG